MRRARTPNLSRAPRLPLVLASEVAECGLACIAMIGRFHGHDVDLNGLRSASRCRCRACPLRSLMGLATSWDFRRARCGSSSPPSPRSRRRRSCIGTINHYVVLRSVTSRSIVIHDPAIGVRTLPLAEVSKHFTGVVLELTPTANFRVVHARAPVRLSSLWSQMTGFASAFLHVIVLSVVLQIAAFAAPFQIQLVIDEAVFHADQDLLTVLALAFGALVVIQALVEALRGWTLRVFGHLLSFPDRRQPDPAHAAPAGRVLREASRRRRALTHRRGAADQEAITARGRFVDHRRGDGVCRHGRPVLLFGRRWRRSWCSPSPALGARIRALSRHAHRMEEEILARAKEQSHLMESVRAATTIKLMGREAERESAWRNLSADLTNAGISVGKYQISMDVRQTLLTGLVYVIIVFLGARLILTGQGFSVGMLFAFLSFRQTLNDRAVGFINQLVQFRLLGLHLDRLADIITAVPRNRRRANPEPGRERRDQGARPLLSLRRVRPAHPPGHRPQYRARQLRCHHRALGRRQDDAVEAAPRPAPADIGHHRSRWSSRGSGAMARVANACGRGGAG
jgi:ATP-binding cassette subfamily B protein RaxB